MKAERFLTIARDIICLGVGATGILYITFTTKDPSKVNEFLLSLLGILLGAPTLIGGISLVRNSSANGESTTPSGHSPSTQAPPSASSSPSSSS